MRTPGATTDSGGAGRHARADEDDAVSGSMPTEAAAGRTAEAATGTGAAAHVGAGAEAVRDEVGGNAPSRTPTSADDEPAVMRRQLDLALGQAWDDELEPFRYAGAGAPVRWLHRVG